MPTRWLQRYSTEKGINRVAHSVTKNAIDHSRRNQESDFPVSDRKWIHRNPPSPPTRCFDDTVVSEFEIALSIELQMAFKEKDISCLRIIECG